MSKTTKVRFNKHHVTDGTSKARVFYSLDNRVDGRKVVTIYAKDFGSSLSRMFPEAYENKKDSQSDYFDQGTVRLFEDSPYYTEARNRVERGFKK